MVAVLVSDGGKNCGNGAGDAPYPATGFDSSSKSTESGRRVHRHLAQSFPIAIESHISHINPTRCVVISNIGDRCSRIADHSSYHEC